MGCPGRKKKQCKDWVRVTTSGHERKRRGKTKGETVAVHKSKEEVAMTRCYTGERKDFGIRTEKSGKSGMRGP